MRASGRASARSASRDAATRGDLRVATTRVPAGAMPRRLVARGVSPCGWIRIDRHVAGCREVSWLSESQRKMLTCERRKTGGSSSKSRWPMTARSMVRLWARQPSSWRF